MPQTKQRQDHTKRLQSVEDQAPYGEHINSKACGTHSRRASSHLHMPLICIFTKKGPSGFPSSANPSPRPHQHTPLWLRKGSRAGNVCSLGPHMHIEMIHKYTQNAQNQFLPMLYTNVQRQSKQKSERELVRSGDVSTGRAHLISTPPSFPPSPSPALLSSLSPLIIRYLVTSGPW